MDATITVDTMFVTGSGETVSFSDVMMRIKKYLEGVDDYSIDVGSDSHTTDRTKVITAIAVREVGKGGIFFHTCFVYPKMRGLHERIYKETELSIEAAQCMVKAFLDNDMAYTLSIHSDVGNNGKTRELIREIIGYVTGSGFNCLIKPDGYVACAIADKYSK